MKKIIKTITKESLERRKKRIKPQDQVWDGRLRRWIKTREIDLLTSSLSGISYTEYDYKRAKELENKLQFSPIRDFKSSESLFWPAIIISAIGIFLVIIVIHLKYR